jgi:tRNA (mo5U34)-methyltransferase
MAARVSAVSALFAELLPAEPAPIAPELRRELDRPPPWMYPWPLRDGTGAPVHSEELVSVHQTRREMIEPVVRAALATAGPGARVLDLGCNEGLFAHLARAWGAGHVLGCDIRDNNIRRATAIRDHYGISPAELEFRCVDALTLDSAPCQFDLVLALGLIYHLEDPVGALRVARRMLAPDGLCVVESQLTRQREPVVHGWGSSRQLHETAASFAVKFEDEPENLLASTSGVLSLIPNAAALEIAMQVAGFSGLRWLEATPDHDEQYVIGDRRIIIGRAATSDPPPTRAPLARQVNPHLVRVGAIEAALAGARDQISALSIREQEAVLMLERAREELAAAERRLGEAEDTRAEAEQRRAEAERWLADHRTSFSWKITAPLRAAKRSLTARRSANR